MLNIGLSLRSDVSSGQLWYGNGISQNIKFLYDLFELLGHHPFFLLFDQPMAEPVRVGDKHYETQMYSDMISSGSPIDLVLEVGVTINPDLRGPLRERGARIITVKFGNDLIIDVEQIVFHNPERAGIVRERGPDALWISPHFNRSKSYFEVLYDCEADVCPYIWEPDFVGARFSPEQLPEQPTIYVMEANINVMKTAMIPMCIIEKLDRINSDSFEKAMILNGLHFKDKPYFLNNIVRNMPSLGGTRDKVYFTGRYTFDQAFQRPDILLSHQWECELNYLYLEALYKGVPLVHNSPLLKDVGFYYPESEVHAGAEQCLRAIHHYDMNYALKQNAYFLQRFSIHHPVVQHEYQRLLDKAMARS